MLVWEIATGREWCRLVAELKSLSDPKPVVAVMPHRVLTTRFDPGWSGIGLAISPDGELLVQAAGHSARLWDLAAGKELTRLAGHEGDVTAVAFGPDGKTLATGSADTTVLIWNVPALLKDRRAPSAELTLAEVEGHWTTLAGGDAAKAFTAIRALAAAPGQALPILKKRLTPAAADDDGQVARWIADLDSDKFAVRQTAVMELEKVDEAQAIEPVEKAIKGNYIIGDAPAIGADLEQTGRRSPSRYLACRSCYCGARADRLSRGTGHRGNFGPRSAGSARDGGGQGVGGTAWPAGLKGALRRCKSLSRSTDRHRFPHIPHHCPEKSVGQRALLQSLL